MMALTMVLKLVVVALTTTPAFVAASCRFRLHFTQSTHVQMDHTLARDFAAALT